MKKILILFLVTALASQISAQNVDFDKLRLGIQVTPTSSWMNTNDNQIVSNGTKLGLNLGFMAEYYFAENY